MAGTPARRCRVRLAGGGGGRLPRRAAGDRAADRRRWPAAAGPLSWAGSRRRADLGQACDAGRIRADRGHVRCRHGVASGRSGMRPVPGCSPAGVESRPARRHRRLGVPAGLLAPAAASRCAAVRRCDAGSVSWRVPAGAAGSCCRAGPATVPCRPVASGGRAAERRPVAGTAGWPGRVGRAGRRGTGAATERDQRPCPPAPLDRSADRFMRLGSAARTAHRRRWPAARPCLRRPCLAGLARGQLGGRGGGVRQGRPARPPPAARRPARRCARRSRSGPVAASGGRQRRRGGHRRVARQRGVVTSRSPAGRSSRGARKRSGRPSRPAAPAPAGPLPPGRRPS